MVSAWSHRNCLVLGQEATDRHLCMNLLEREPSKLGLSKKRRKATWNDDYRAKVIFG
jgi:hypothetical protein